MWHCKARIILKVQCSNNHFRIHWLIIAFKFNIVTQMLHVYTYLNSVINFFLRLKNISDEFDKVGFTKVKHLAQATLEKVRLVQLSGDSLKLLNGAMEVCIN